MVETELIKKYYHGRIDTDVMSGWEAGKKGLKDAPSHFTGTRFFRWLDGLSAWEKRRKDKSTIVIGYKPGGEKYERRRAGYVSRRIMVTQFERAGCIGEVTVIHMDHATGKLKKHECSI